MNFIPQKDYDNFLTNMVLCCVDVVIVQDQKVLLVKRKTEPAKGEWWFPGGRVYKGELLEECAVRKAKEEVGVDCKVVRQIFTKETIFYSGPNNIPIHSVNICFLLEPIKKINNIKLDDFSSDFKWISEISNDINNSYVISAICDVLPTIRWNKSII